MNDFIDQYRQRVRRKLSRKESEPVVRKVELLCLPSFHAETVLRIVERPDGTVFRLFTLTENLWCAEDEKAVERFHESASVSKRRADKFWKSVTEMAPLATKVDEILDGMTVLLALQIDGIFIEVETNNLNSNRPIGMLIARLLNEGASALRDANSRERLKEIREYL